MALNSESLTYWYFRLNGFFTIPNFIVHSDRGTLQRTDVDVFGIRLPNRRELLQDPMEDDEVFSRVTGKAFIAMVLRVTARRLLQIVRYGGADRLVLGWPVPADEPVCAGTPTQHM